MTPIAKENTLRHFETMTSVDMGWAANEKLQTIENIVRKAIECGGSFTLDSELEVSFMIGASINLGCDGLNVLTTLDLNVVQLDDMAVYKLVDYFKEMTADYYWYAKQAA